jgi:phosphonate transport system ATP-binding protein
VSAASESPEVRLSEVSVGFRGRTAVHRVSVTVTPGECVAIIGRSGAGKTTLLRCLSRALTPTGGAIRVGDVDLAALRGRKLAAYRVRVGVIYQQFNLVRRLTVLSNVLVARLAHLSPAARWLALGGIFPADDRRVALRCLDHVGLLGRAWQRTDTLSGGEQQRVAIARLLAQEPRLILADEPVASLDLSNGALVMATLRRIASEGGLTAITTLHHVDYARRYCDRVLGMREGRLVFDGPPAALGDRELELVFGDPSAPGARTAGAPSAHPAWAPT